MTTIQSSDKSHPSSAETADSSAHKATRPRKVIGITRTQALALKAVKEANDKLGLESPVWLEKAAGLALREVHLGRDREGDHSSEDDSAQ